MTHDEAQLLWIRAHVMLHARCPDSARWRYPDLHAAFCALPPADVCPFDAWVERAGIQIDDASGAQPTDREQLKAAIGKGVPLYDPQTKGPLT